MGAYFFPTSATPLEGKTPQSVVQKSEDSFSESTEAEEEESPQSLSQNLPVSSSEESSSSREIAFESAPESSLSEDNHGASPDIVITVPKEILGALITQAHELKGVKVQGKNRKGSVDDLKKQVVQWVKQAKEAAPHMPFTMVGDEKPKVDQLRSILTQGIELLESSLKS